MAEARNTDKVAAAETAEARRKLAAKRVAENQKLAEQANARNPPSRQVRRRRAF